MQKISFEQSLILSYKEKSTGTKKTAGRLALESLEVGERGLFNFETDFKNAAAAKNAIYAVNAMDNRELESRFLSDGTGVVVHRIA